MTLPVVNLDDRQFDDLAAEARERLRQALPELAGLAPGDPLYYLTDVFAQLTGELIHRANLIPERQRRVFLNLLAVPERPARPARGLVALDLSGRSVVPRLIPAETALEAAGQRFITGQEVLATPLVLRLVQKRAASADPAALAELYPELDPRSVRTFAAVEPVAGRDPVRTADTVDGALYLALCVPRALARPDALARVRAELKGQLVNVGLIPRRDAAADAEAGSDLAFYTRPAPRRLDWRIAWCRSDPGAGGATGRPDCRWLPLEVLDDGSDGARQAGVVRLRLPEADELLAPVQPADPADAGLGDTPPALPPDQPAESLICWLRLAAPDDALDLSWLGINAVAVSGQGIERDLVVGIGSGESGQRLRLGRTDIDPASLRLEVERGQAFAPWQRVEHFAASGPDDPVYRFDPRAGLIAFGDGLHGLRPPAGKRIRVAVYRYGGGSAGNLPAGAITALAEPVSGVKVRHDYPTWGGADAEGITEAEQRIAETLRHRNRAVTERDFIELTLANPIAPVARAELLAGFHPGREFADARAGVPGVISLLVLPPAPDDGRFPKPDAGLLRDVHQYLSERTLLGTELYVLSPRFVPIGISTAVDAVDPGQQLAVERAVEASLRAHLWPLAPGGLAGTGWQLGRAVEASELYTAVARVPGVRAIHAIQLQLPTGAGWRPAADNRVELPGYGLPEPVAIACAASGPALPALDPTDLPLPDGVAPTPVPVMPDLC